MSISSVANKATSHVGVAELTGKAVEQSPPGCRVPKLQDGGKRYPAWVIFFVADAISVDVQRKKDDASSRVLIASLGVAHFHVMGERGEIEEHLLPRNNITGWSKALEDL